MLWAANLGVQLSKYRATCSETRTGALFEPFEMD